MKSCLGSKHSPENISNLSPATNCPLDDKQGPEVSKLRQSLINIQHDCRTIMSAQIIAAISKQNIHCTNDQISKRLAAITTEDNWPLKMSEDEVLKIISNTAQDKTDG